MIDAYLAQLSPSERVALGVAQRTFGASFRLERTIGYLTFLQKKSAAVNLAR